jgi:hypothetical protein
LIQQIHGQDTDKEEAFDDIAKINDAIKEFMYQVSDFFKFFIVRGSHFWC